MLIQPLNINPFHSFWMAGYECTDKLNCFGDRVDFLTVTGHLDKMEEDYQNLSFLQIKTVREGIRWSKVEYAPYKYNWTDVEKMIHTGKENGIQQVWDLCHFGFPDDLTPLHPMFARRFAAMCRAFVQFYRSIDPEGTIIVTPINEVSFLSWLGGDVCGTSPYCKSQGWEVKYKLMKAYIEGITALKEVDASVRIMPTEPLVNMVPPVGATADQIEEARQMHEQQYQVYDMLCGKACPELGGRPEYLDILGCNFYYNNQWIAGLGQFLEWRNLDKDPRWRPLSSLMEELYLRYKRPVVLSETSHPHEDRPVWMEYVANECCRLLQKNIPLWGLCWYPILDRPDWDHLYPWHHAGIWDVDRSNENLERILHEPTATAFIEAQAKLKPLLKSSQPEISGDVHGLMKETA